MAHQEQLANAAAALKAGQAVVFPTDTVYGIAVLPSACESPALLYQLKRRPTEKPVAWLVGGIEDLLLYGRDVPEYAVQLAKRYWPGALTLIVHASEAVPAAYQSAEHTIGLRLPAGQTALELIALVKSPLATTSANISGKASAMCEEELDAQLCQEVSYVLAGERCKEGIASTVVDCTGSEPKVLRQGSLIL